MSEISQRRGRNFEVPGGDTISWSPIWGLSPVPGGTSGLQGLREGCCRVLRGVFEEVSGPTIKAPFLRAYSSEFLELGEGVCLRKSIISSLFPNATPFRGELLAAAGGHAPHWRADLRVCYCRFLVLNISAWSAVA